MRYVIPTIVETSSCFNAMYFILQLECEPLETVTIKNPVSVKVWSVSVKVWLISWKPLTWGVIFRVRDYVCLIRNIYIYIYKMVIFFVFLSCTAMCTGNLSLMKLQVGWF